MKQVVLKSRFCFQLQWNQEVTGGQTAPKVVKVATKWRNCSLIVHHKIIGAILVIAFAVSCFAADQPKPESLVQDNCKKNAFLTKRNLFLLSAAAASITADGYTTQKFLADNKNYETNPIAGMFGKSRAATAGIDAFSFAGVAGGTYLAHRKHWRHIEWIIPLAVASTEAGFAIHNTQMPTLPKTTFSAGIDIFARSNH